ncbi:MAG TPA: cyanophycin synthetase [Candidatus Limnocylindrales bacterium]|nr:cyanophycin synthetase [Candidatus Limnocylindrales bacterium]
MTRTAEEIARGLEPVRPARPLAPGTRLHVVGAEGAAAAGALLLAKARGAAVSGCDTGGPSPYGPALERAGIAVATAHDAGHVVGPDGQRRADLLAVSKAITSVRPDHPELLAAHGAGVPAVSCQQVIADAAATGEGRLLAVAGTHGKSTTTGWLIHLLTLGGADPAGFCGAVMPAALTGGPPSVVRLGSGPAFVVEADEYAGNFDPYRPAIGVLLNADWDHPDVFADRAVVEDAFEAWIRRFQGARGEPPTLVANAGDPGAAAVLARLADWPGRILAFTTLDAEGARLSTPQADAEAHVEADAAAARLRATIRSALGPADVLVGRTGAEPDGRQRLTVHGLPGVTGGSTVTLQLVGRHNADDALGAAGAALAFGLPANVILAGLASFEGVGRRFELKGEARGVAILDDFGHHPTAIAATLAAVRQRYPGRRVWAVYEPLTFHRTAAMLEAFADVLATADRAAVADIYAVRDPDTTIVSPADLARAVAARGTPAEAPGSVEETADWLAGEVRPGDVVLVMGGGRSYVIAERLAAALAAPASMPTAPDGRG